MLADDDSPNLFEDEPTPVDGMGASGASERKTRIYRSADFLTGREVGFSEGIDVTVATLKIELVRAGCTEDEIASIEARVRGGAAERR